jgi:hypothetical protein
MCVALAALDAQVLVTGNSGERRIAFTDFHRLPGDTPQTDSNLKADEIITAIELPSQGFARNYTYLKIRDRLSYAFALVSVAVGLELEGGTIKQARFALGGQRQALAQSRCRGAARPCAAYAREFRAGGRDGAAGGPRLRPQRLQDRAGAARHVAGARTGGTWHAAVAIRQASEVRGGRQWPRQ